tara:strand:- start:7743 stop:7985 length:243 start_codon:yes stop_codon:yes gene_type:complete
LLFELQLPFRIKKFIKLPTLLGANFCLAGGASAEETLPAVAEEGAAHRNAAADMVESHDAQNEGMLMGQYKSGQISGYRD